MGFMVRDQLIITPTVQCQSAEHSLSKQKPIDLDEVLIIIDCNDENLDLLLSLSLLALIQDPMSVIRLLTPVRFTS